MFISSVLVAGYFQVASTQAEQQRYSAESVFLSQSLPHSEVQLPQNEVENLYIRLDTLLSTVEPHRDVLLNASYLAKSIGKNDESKTLSDKAHYLDPNSIYFSE